MLIQLANCSIRDYRDDDLDRLVRLGNNPKIWKQVRDRFPNPYTRDAGEAFIAKVKGEDPRVSFAIAVDDLYAGGIGVTLGSDIHARSAEVGYWLGEEYWGRGIAAEALGAFTLWAFAQYDLIRMWASVFTYNPGSARVLEKAGFKLEATFRQAAVKLGVVCDEWHFGRIRGE
jgi:[ribosomal protein S5]-alanine N-acetyltransferase